METQPVNQTPQLDFKATVLSLTEKHLREWIEQLNYLQESQGPADGVAFCQSQIAQLRADRQRLQEGLA